MQDEMRSAQHRSTRRGLPSLVCCNPIYDEEARRTLGQKFIVLAGDVMPWVSPRSRRSVVEAEVALESSHGALCPWCACRR